MADEIKEAEPTDVSLPEPDIGDRIKRVRGLTEHEKRTLAKMEQSYFKPGGFWNTAFGRTLSAHNRTGKIISSVAGIALFFIPGGEKLESHVSTLINTIQQKSTNMAQSTGLLGWLKARLSEASTYQGLVAILSVLGVSLSPDMLHSILALGVSLIGLIQIIKAETKK